MYKWIMFVLFIGASAMGVGFLFQDINARQAERAAEETAGASLKIAASNWKFDQAEYKIPKGQTKVSLILKEGVHAIDITGEGVDVKLDGTNKSQEVNFEKPGKYEIKCILPCGEGHNDMKSVLVVE
ncbi:hypothetical protein ACFVVQ_00875 [Paenibacillus chitinolyticus]|uniref:hypothetical protein n=1 Tax=Paenibacillus TaxID=44249 RepID=UPI00020D6869|nr:MULTISPECIES: hypothetical protein [Paenibacillus]EGL17184.1 hypothetical protein HMPREF9413_5519 [Paenibacillus sp. HGF7]EPD80709.1 hypothetical protein HMPREF1207_04465 [Paenibacillus sp. HGH0039]MBV6714574.1 hypothetical protein [Paenibacillus chitinolyticus]MEC0245679.1 hypothetical protein [Paenibacillus chitinolyticus]